ncbi:hypothetical protein CAOG_06467 [Capsaspora owczarzaki ATCC 30864]|uniref:Peptidase M43 pregnancy-associated plasma-A domain-containing protein n=1 Tax=Capsaspora owczarzaki (strain ATCC 30864) TaxID=595528 RepID=A0A0D2WVD5_CAPO3|nr:hypothetical protein CAOG_06467 [Capsaspora owczarzaki ATCC 30864]KJE96098.1 hypothetical protein CAOG_006467 [Capsaspora owczarzaki ATCC 30864]|eukprot:XP_004345216.1 hypothetical protein CAOG_06467 [Capsaspora owczarzaki ATCC 30864]
MQPSAKVVAVAVLALLVAMTPMDSVIALQLPQQVQRAKGVATKAEGSGDPMLAAVKSAFLRRVAGPADAVAQEPFVEQAGPMLNQHACGLDEAAKLFRGKAFQDANRRSEDGFLSRRALPYPEYRTPVFSPTVPTCLQEEGADFFGFVNNECFLSEITNLYSDLDSDWPTATIKIKFHYFADTSGANPQMDSSQSAVLLEKLAEYYQHSPAGDSKIRFSFSYAPIHSTALKTKWTNTPFNAADPDYSVMNDLNVPAWDGTDPNYIHVCVIPMAGNIVGLGYPPHEQIASVVDWDAPSFILIRYDFLYPAGIAGGMSGQNGTTLAHEIGHTLTLFHTFQNAGNDDFTTRDCQTCSPRVGQAYTGDFISDTNPISNQLSFYTTSCTNYGYGNAMCDGSSFVNPPNRNIMGYSQFYCMTQFSKLQMSRMRCSIDRYLRQHTVEGLTNLVASGNYLTIDKSDMTALKLYWTPPINSLSSVSAIAPPTSYELTRFNATTTVTWTVTGMSYVDESAHNYSTYTYYVRGLNSAGAGVPSQQLEVVNDGKVKGNGVTTLVPGLSLVLLCLSSMLVFALF